MSRWRTATKNVGRGRSRSSGRNPPTTPAGGSGVAGFLLINLGNAVATASVGRVWFAVVFLVLLVVLVVFGGRQARQARLFLEEHRAHA